MKRAARVALILELLADHGHFEVDDVVEVLGDSGTTVRRDLDLVVEQKLLTRTHGGARASSVSYDLPLRYKSTQHKPAEPRIAAAAAAAQLVPLMLSWTLAAAPRVPRWLISWSDG